MKGLRQLLKRLASLYFTLGCLLLLLVSIFAGNYTSLLTPGWAVAVPLFMLAINLLAAISVRPKFRQNRALLMFHLFLLLLVVLVALGRMTYLRGWVELTEGIPFSGVLAGGEVGPWHRWKVADLDLVVEDFSINYSPGRLPTSLTEEDRSEVPAVLLQAQQNSAQTRFQWRDSDNEVRHTTINDPEPLVLQGYRFSMGNNKGFTPVFGWQPHGQSEQRGAVHLPAYPQNIYTQAQEFDLPGQQHPVWIELQFDEEIISAVEESTFRVPREYTVVLRLDKQRYELKPGESIDFPEGRLRLVEVRRWLGLDVTADWTLPWLLATILAVVLSLAVYLWNKSFARSWRDVIQ